MKLGQGFWQIVLANLVAGIITAVLLWFLMKRSPNL